MEAAEGRNQTIIMEFILLGFGNGPEVQPFLFLLFLVLYLETVAGNLLIVTLVMANGHLHTPMYFFLGNLSCVEICYSSVILPRLLASLLTGDRTISVQGCLVQLYFFGVMATAENLMLLVMSYDRFLAICHPLRYTMLMNGQVCCRLVAGAWGMAVLLCAIIDTFLFQLTFCDSREIDHFFCDLSPVINLSCDDTWTLQVMAFVVSSITLGACLLILMSYVCILSSILQIPSKTGRQKAFSTCSSHLIVVAIFYGTLIAVYVFPMASTSKVLSKVSSVCYTVLTPLINPVIYSLRNKEVSESLRKALLKPVCFRNMYRSFRTNFSSQ